MTRIRLLQPRLVDWQDDYLMQVALYTLVLSSLLFIMFPSLDMYVSGLFHVDGNFPLSDNLPLKRLRDVARRAPHYIIAFNVAIIIIFALFPRMFRSFAPHKAVFVLSTFLFGPLLTVHALKFFIGRQRPREILEFGGMADFTPAWQYAGTCAHSCSFPSGESAVAAATLSLVVFVPQRWRGGVIALSMPLLFLVSFNRVLFGAHFLSDVILSWSMVFCIMTLLWRYINIHSHAIDTSTQKLGLWLSKHGSQA